MLWEFFSQHGFEFQKNLYFANIICILCGCNGFAARCKSMNGFASFVGVMDLQPDANSMNGPVVV